MNFTSFIATVLALSIFQLVVESKIYKKCDLAKTLERNEISRTFVSTWVCIAQAESNFDTSKKQSFPNLSSSFGILQINSKDWCREGRKGGRCNAKCEDFLNDDINDDIRCAKLIAMRDGFKAWKGFEKKCKAPNPLPDVSMC
uniref:lysozyme n=1 Tax=Corethrella appendiculata TaxID=1370023 RepID=U5ETW1_9DIPT